MDWTLAITLMWQAYLARQALTCTCSCNMPQATQVTVLPEAHRKVKSPSRPEVNISMPFGCLLEFQVHLLCNLSKPQ